MTATPDLRHAMLSRLLILAIVGGLLPLGATFWWPLELTSHFRLQYLAAALLLLMLGLLRRRRVLAFGLLAVIAVNAWPLLAYLPRAAPAMSGEVLSILNLNARARNAEHDRVLGVIRSAQADVVTLIELSRELDARLVELADVYPYRETVPADNNFGLGILSRYPFAATETFALEPNPAIAVTLELPARRIRLIAAHLAPPMGRTLAATRNRQLDALAELALVAADPLIICGDFNLTPYSPYFRRFTDAAGLRDTRQGRGIRISWPATLPLLGIPIDHCFVNGLTVSRSIETMDQTGSDHYPVRVRLGWPEPQ